MGHVKILIAGVSATGKSAFGGWLARTKGFMHVDMELPDDEPYSWRSHGLKDEWNDFCNGSDRDRLLRALKARPSSVVLNWGFPPNLITLRCVSDLKAAGVSLWWFDGDHMAARKRFEVRAKGRRFLGSLHRRRVANELNVFDRQYNAITSYWESMEPLFRGHVITTLRPDGSFMEKEDICSIMGL